MSNPIICTSEWLRKSKETAEVAKAIAAALEKLHVEHRELRHTNDYWCRDYMPVRLSDSGTYARYTYSPDYLVEDKKMLPYITEQGEACRELNLFAPADMDIVFDGGNFVRCGNKVIMTDKIFSENPKWLVHNCFLAYLNISIARTTSLPSKPSNDCFRIWKSFLSIQSRLSEKAGRYIV